MSAVTDWISACADIVTGIAAAVGAGYFIWDRHGSPPIHVWAETERCLEPRAVEVRLYAVSYTAKASMVRQISVPANCEIAIRMQNYSPIMAKRNLVEPTALPAQLKWKRKFTLTPRAVPGVKAEGGYEPFISIFIRPSGLNAAITDETTLSVVLQLIGRTNSHTRKLTVDFGKARAKEAILRS